MQILERFRKITSLLKKNKDEHQAFIELKNSFKSNGKQIYAGLILKLAYEKNADKTALIGEQKTIKYKEFYFRSILLSQKLKECGVVPRDKVLLFFENSLEFYIAYFAIWQVGAVVVPLNIFLHSKELAYVIKDCGANVAIISSKLKKKWDKLVEEKLLNDLPLALTGDDIDWVAPVPERIENQLPDFKIECLNPDELCLLLYTSGTTGKPKGVMLSSRNVLTNAIQAHARLSAFGKKENERFFSVLPLFHVFAQNVCLWLPVLTSSSIIIVSKIDRKLILEGLKKRPTLFFAFPALYGLLCLLKTAPLDSIRMFVSGADMLPDKIRAAFSMIYGRKICSGYGLTEASPIVALNDANERQATNVVGHVLQEIECDIRDDQEKSLCVNKVGTLWVRGENIMLGYYNAPDQTAKVLKNGWLNTGDLAVIDEKGRLAISGRSKDLIIHKGFNIYPQEVENVLMSHPAVFKVAVIGKTESISGQVPIAYVAVKEQGENLENSLRVLCSSNLATYKIPRKFVCLDDLPLNATGKVDKKQLNAL